MNTIFCQRTAQFDFATANLFGRPFWMYNSHRYLPDENGSFSLSRFAAVGKLVLLSGNTSLHR
jgi:hypothetical protein